MLGLVDVEANYAVVKAYQYTTITSVQVGVANASAAAASLAVRLSVLRLRPQLLDCFVIPVLMLLSWWALKTRYRLVHYLAVCVCLLGVGAMVGADLLAGRDQGSSKNPTLSLSSSDAVLASKQLIVPCASSKCTV